MGSAAQGEDERLTIDWLTIDYRHIIGTLSAQREVMQLKAGMSLRGRFVPPCAGASVAQLRVGARTEGVEWACMIARIKNNIIAGVVVWLASGWGGGEVGARIFTVQGVANRSEDGWKLLLFASYSSKRFKSQPATVRSIKSQPQLCQSPGCGQWRLHGPYGGGNRSCWSPCSP